MVTNWCDYLIETKKKIPQPNGRIKFFRIHVIYMKSGIWVYPVMDVLSLPLRILFFLALFAFSALLYFAGEKLDHLIWGNEKSKQQKKHTKSK